MVNDVKDTFNNINLHERTVRLHVIDGVGRLEIERDHLAGQRLDKDLRPFMFFPFLLLPLSFRQSAAGRSR